MVGLASGAQAVPQATVTVDAFWKADFSSLPGSLPVTCGGEAAVVCGDSRLIDLSAIGWETRDEAHFSIISCGGDQHLPAADHQFRPASPAEPVELRAGLRLIA